jgi:Domain of unknown function (DUF3846)
MSRPKKQDEIKVLVIDPFSRIIREDIIKNSLEDMYRVTKCRCITAVYLSDTDCMYLDDEGLLVDPNQQAFFSIDGATHPFAGHAVVVGTDAEGNSADVKMNIFELGDKVRFLGTPKIESEDESGAVWGFV